MQPTRTVRCRGGASELCAEESALGPLCPAHLAREYKVRVGPSRIPGAGLGLFAHDPGAEAGERVFGRGERVIPYEGETASVRTERQAIARDPGRRVYALDYSAGRRAYTVDGSDPLRSSAARYANDAKAPGTPKGVRNNADFRILDGAPWLCASRAIRNGEEILVEYGSGYWGGRR